MKLNDDIKSIDELLQFLEEVIDEYSTVDDRRRIIVLIDFIKRQQSLGRSLNDIVWWIKKWDDDNV